MTSDDMQARYDALNEILRLEPVIANIYRKAHEPVTFKTEGEDITIPPENELLFISMMSMWMKQPRVSSPPASTRSGNSTRESIAPC